MADIASPIKTLGAFPAVDPTVAAIGTADQIADGETRVSMRMDERTDLGSLVADAGWLYAGSLSAAPLVTDLAGNILQLADNGYIYTSRDPEDPADVAAFTRQARRAGLDNVWTYDGSAGALVTDLLGNILSLSRGGTIYTIPDPDDPLFAQAVADRLDASGLGNVWTYGGSAGAIITDLAGNILATTASLTAGAGAIRRLAPQALKAGTMLTTGRDWTGTLISGQSLTAGENADGVVSATQPFANLTFGSGPGSTKAGSVGVNGSPGVSTSMALIETVARAEDSNPRAGETPCSGTANYAVERALRGGHIVEADDYVNFAWTSGHTGYSIDQLTNDAWFQLLRDQVDAFVALATAAGKTHNIPCIFWVQGNNDVTAGTGYAGYQAKMKAYRLKVEAYVQSKIADNGPVAMVMVQTEYGLTIDNSIALAQVDLAKSEPHFYMVGPTWHLPHVTTESHLVAAGYKWLGCYFGRAKAQLEMEQVEPDWLRLLSVTYRAGEVKFRFRVPVQPIVIDESLCGPTVQQGLAIKDSTGLVALSNIRVTGADEISATCARVPLAGATGRVGLDYRGGNIRLSSATTANLRDSEDETCVVAGITRPLYRVAPAQELPILFLEG